MDKPQMASGRIGQARPELESQLELDKWAVIKALHDPEDPYGVALLRLMDWCGATNLQDVTDEQARAYYAARDKTAE